MIEASNDNCHGSSEKIRTNFKVQLKSKSNAKKKPFQAIADL